MTASSTVLAVALALCSAGSFLSAHAANTTANPDHAENDADFVCPEYLSILDRLYYTQMVFGSLSIFACSAVITVLCETTSQQRQPQYTLSLVAAIRFPTLRPSLPAVPTHSHQHCLNL